MAPTKGMDLGSNVYDNSSRLQTANLKSTDGRGVWTTGSAASARLAIRRL